MDSILDQALFECDSCHEVKPDVDMVLDPYDLDVNDEEVWVALCDQCYEERAADI